MKKQGKDRQKETKKKKWKNKGENERKRHTQKKKKEDKSDLHSTTEGKDLWIKKIWNLHFPPPLFIRTKREDREKERSTTYF